MHESIVVKLSDHNANIYPYLLIAKTWYLLAILYF